MRPTEVACAPVLLHPQFLYPRSLPDYDYGPEGQGFEELVEPELLELPHRLLHRTVSDAYGHKLWAEQRHEFRVGFEADALDHVATQPLVGVVLELGYQVVHVPVRVDGRRIIE